MIATDDEMDSADELWPDEGSNEVVGTERVLAQCRVPVQLCYTVLASDRYQGLAAKHDFACGKAVSLIAFKIQIYHGYF